MYAVHDPYEKESCVAENTNTSISACSSSLDLLLLLGLLGDSNSIPNNLTALTLALLLSNNTHNLLLDRIGQTSKRLFNRLHRLIDDYLFGTRDRLDSLSDSLLCPLHSHILHFPHRRHLKLIPKLLQLLSLLQSRFLLALDLLLPIIPALCHRQIPRR